MAASWNLDHPSSSLIPALLAKSHTPKPLKTLADKQRQSAYKTGIRCRCPLWPETVKALRAVVGKRETGLVFVTKYGNPWTTTNQRDPIAYEFRKLMGDNHRKGVTTFYSLRRTFETIAGTANVSQFVVDAIMGHVADANDMAAVYRQRVFDKQLRECVEHVRKWYTGRLKID